MGERREDRENQVQMNKMSSNRVRSEEQTKDPLNGNPFHVEINGIYDQWHN